jgi:hypothetical protein
MDLSTWEKSVIHSHYLEEAREHLRGGAEAITCAQVRSAMRRAEKALDRAGAFEDEDEDV